MDTRIYDARELAEINMQTVKDTIAQVKSEYQAVRDPSIEIFRMEGSSEQFRKSIINKCSQVGIEVKEYEIEKDDLTLDRLYDELVDFNSDGYIFIRPAYNPENEFRVNEIIDLFIESMLKEYDIDRMSYEPSNNLYPPVTTAVKYMLNDYKKWTNCDFSRMKAVMIGNSKYVGRPTTSMLSERFGEVIQLHKHSDPKDISRQTSDAAVVVTYRTLDDILLNSDAYIIDIGDDTSVDRYYGSIAAGTKHIGQFTASILLINLISNYYTEMSEWQ